MKLEDFSQVTGTKKTIFKVLFTNDLLKKHNLKVSFTSTNSPRRRPVLFSVWETRLLDCGRFFNSPLNCILYLPWGPSLRIQKWPTSRNQHLCKYGLSSVPQHGGFHTLEATTGRGVHEKSSAGVFFLKTFSPPPVRRATEWKANSSGSPRFWSFPQHYKRGEQLKLSPPQSPPLQRHKHTTGTIIQQVLPT